MLGKVQYQQLSTHGNKARAPPPAGPVFNSLQYEEHESAVYFAHRDRNSKWVPIVRSCLKWCVCLAIALAISVITFFINMSVENLTGFKYEFALGLMHRSHFGAYVVYAACNLALVLVACLLVVFFAPTAAGSGIAEVKAYLNGVNVPNVLGWRPLIGKIVGSTCSVAGGLAVGKEGPMVHIGACVASVLTQGFSTGPLSRSLWLNVFKTDRDRRDFITCGVAAGVSAAFRSPVGGVLFALEEVSTWWQANLLWLLFFTTAMANLGMWAVAKACKGDSCGVYGVGGLTIYEILEGQDTYEFKELVPALLLGVVGGLLGAGFNHANVEVTRIRTRLLAKRANLKLAKVMDAVLISLITTTISYTVPLMFPCRACPAENTAPCPSTQHTESNNFVAYNCREAGHYNDIATLFFNTQDNAIRNLFSPKTSDEFSVGALVAFSSLFYGLMILTAGVAVPIGVLVPSVVLGAAYGRLVGTYVKDVAAFSHIDEGTYAVIGAASFLGGNSRMTVSMAVILLEISNNLALLPLVMLCLLLAKAVGDGTGIKRLYELQCEAKHLPVLEGNPGPYMQHMTAREVATRRVKQLQRVVQVKEIAAVLGACTHNVFPVMGSQHERRVSSELGGGQNVELQPQGGTAAAEGGSMLLGTVTRHDLVVLLQTKLAFSPNRESASSQLLFEYTPGDFRRPVNGTAPDVKDVRLSVEQLEMYVDLLPFINPFCHVVQEHTSLSKVYSMFHGLGLRHLLVVPNASEVQGMITRKDVIQSVAHH